jgi:hypothetical protein
LVSSLSFQYLTIFYAEFTVTHIPKAIFIQHWTFIAFTVFPFNKPFFYSVEKANNPFNHLLSFSNLLGEAGVLPPPKV